MSCHSHENGNLGFLPAQAGMTEGNVEMTEGNTAITEKQYTVSNINYTEYRIRNTEYNQRERVTGIGPVSYPWEGYIMPLYHTR